MVLQCLQDDTTVLGLFLQAAQDRDATVRRGAMWGLASQYRIGSREDRQRICTAHTGLLKDPDASLRQEALNTLGQFGDPQTIDALIDCLRHDASPEVREWAARALGRIGDDRVVEPLMRAIRDKVEWARSAAKVELGDIGDTRAIPALLAIKNVGDQRDRGCTAAALARLGAPLEAFTPRGMRTEDWAVIAPIFGRYGPTKESLQALQARHPRLVDILKAYLMRETDTHGYEQHVMEALVLLNAPGTADAILTHYQNRRSKDGGWYVAEMLLRLRDPRAVDMVITYLRMQRQQPHGQFAAHRLIELAELDDPRVTAFLQELRDVEDAQIRYAVAGALARRGDADALAFLLQPLDADDINTYDAAVRALGESGAPQALEMLLRELGQAEVQMRYPVADALQRWCAVNPDEKAYERMVPVLLEAANKEMYPGLRLSLLQPLAERRDPRALEALITTVLDRRLDNNNALQLLAPYRGDKVVDALISVLEDGTLGMREAAAAQLATVGDARAIPALLRALRDDTTRVRVKAIHALGMLKANAALEPLIAALAEPGTRITAAATDALRTITGQDFREDAKAWRAWWKQQVQ
jgi:HEAT repeat protein